MKNPLKLMVMGCAVIVAASIVSPSSSVMAQGPGGVPIKHAESNTIEGVHFFAAQKSKGGLMLAVYTESDAVKDMAVRAASEARAAGYPLRGIIFGPVRDDARSVVEFYTDAQLFSTYLNPPSSDVAAIVAEARRGYVEIVLPRLRSGKSTGN